MNDLDQKLGLLYQIKDETNQYKLINLFAEYFKTPIISKEQYLQSNKKYVIRELRKDALKALEEIEEIINE